MAGFKQVLLALVVVLCVAELAIAQTKVCPPRMVTNPRPELPVVAQVELYLTMHRMGKDPPRCNWVKRNAEAVAKVWPIKHSSECRATGTRMPSARALVAARECRAVSPPKTARAVTRLNWNLKTHFCVAVFEESPTRNVPIFSMVSPELHVANLFTYRGSPTQFVFSQFNNKGFRGSVYALVSYKTCKLSV